MDDVSEMTMPGVFIDWHNTPVTDPVIPTPTRIQEDTTPPTEAFSPEQESLVAVNTDQLLEDLSNQNKELLQERRNALRWQDTASMAFKEAKDETESQKQEAKAAKKTGLLTAAKLRQQLAECIGQVAALKRGKTDAGLEKSRAEAKHRKEISVIERKIKELQISLVSAISHGRGSIRLFDELSGICQSMLDELVAKDRKLAAIETEKEKLQDRIDARSSVVEDISVIAHKNLEAYQKSSREKMKSEKAQQAAERKVGDLERKAVQVKAATDNAVQVLETKLANYVAQGEEANARVTKAEGDAEQLRRDLDNTEMARRNFEKKEGDWAARFAAEGSNPSERSSEGSSSEDWKQGIRHELEEKNKTTLATERKKFRHELKETNRTILATERRKIRHELDETNKTELATEREKIRDELTKEKRKVVVAAAKPNRVNFRFSLKAPLAADLESQKNKELRKVHQRAVAKRVKGKKGQVDWYSVKLVSTPVEVDRSQLEAQIRGELEDEVQNRLAAQATGLQNSHDHEKSQLGPQIRSQLQTELQTKYDTTERPRLEAEIRTRLETEIRAELTTEFQHKQTAFFDSERSGLEAKIRADIQDQNQNTATAGSPEGAMLLESMSTESNEAHELLQEIASVGIPRGSAAENVLQGLNRAKEALYNVKCELRQQEALADKNELLSAVKGVHISTHYIGKLNANTQQVLIRQAIEANRRLEYVKNTLATNDDVAKDEMLKTLLEPLEPESEDMVIPEYPTIGSVSGNSTAFGTSSFSQTFNRVREPTVSSTSNFTAVNDSANSAPLGQSAFPLTVNSFGNVATPGNSGTNQRSSVSTDLKPNNGFRDTTTLGESKTSTPGVFNPFEASHFYNQPSLISALSQNDQDSGRSGRTTETNGNGKSQFKKTFQPLPPQGEGSAPPVGMGIAASPTPTFNFNDLSSTFRTDSSSMDHQMHRDGNQPPPSASQDQSGVIGVAISPSRSRQAKTSRGQQRRSVPKGRQLAHQAFAKDTLTSMPARTQHTNPQEQVPAAQTFESFGIPRTAFTLEPNHAFGE